MTAFVGLAEAEKYKSRLITKKKNEGKEYGFIQCFKYSNSA
jgi:hypothetical protein